MQSVFCQKVCPFKTKELEGGLFNKRGIMTDYYCADYDHNKDLI